MKTRLLLALAALAPAAFATEPAADSALLARLQAQYPATRFTRVAPTPVPGLYEIVMGANVAYVHADGRYFLFGHLFDMQTQRDLTAARSPQAPEPDARRIDFAALPLHDAIKVVHGKGTRAIAVFSDPDCPYCKRLEAELAQLPDLTVHTFLLAFGSHEHAAGIWCAPDRTHAWAAFMRRGDASALAPRAHCDHPLARNLALAQRLGVRGTPAIVAADGRLHAGALTAAELEAWLGSGTPASPTASR